MTNYLEQAIDLVFHQEKHLFLSGGGGVGKSYLIKELKANADSLCQTMILTATTGVAAVGIGGTTVHSWSGVGTGEASIDTLYNKIIKNPRAVKKWRETTHLAIDEVSMLGASLFIKLEELARRIRKTDLFFGGIKLILSGDSCQLPPVNDKFWFDSSVWLEMIRERSLGYIRLTIPHRYPDIDFYNLLLRTRVGTLTQTDIDLLQTRVVAYHELQKKTRLDDIKPTRLYGRRVDVEKINLEELDKLPDQSYIYKCKDKIVSKNKVLQAKVSDYEPILDKIIPADVELRIGAQVMLKANLSVETGLCNGSRGVVTACSDTDGVMVKFKNGVEILVSYYAWEIDDKVAKVSRAQIPLILAWACTIHSIQGSTLDYVIADLGPSIFMDNMAYVALSRCRTLEGIFLQNLVPSKIKTNPRSLDFELLLDTLNAENGGVAEWEQFLDVSDEKEEETWIDQILNNFQIILKKQNHESIEIGIDSGENPPTEERLDAREEAEEKKSDKCEACTKYEVNGAIVPCGHTYCIWCLRKFTECPKCLKKIQHRLKIYH